MHQIAAATEGACTQSLDLARLHGENIYTSFVNGPTGPAQRWVQPDTVSWGLDARRLHTILDRTRPSFIVEVGTWKGLTAITMGQWLKAQSSNASCPVIVCVDTWLGTTPAWTHRDTSGNTLFANAGYPSIFYQWLFNIKHAGLEELVVPLPLPSTMGALYFANSKLAPDLVFIDVRRIRSNKPTTCRIPANVPPAVHKSLLLMTPALISQACHDYPCVYADILSWYPLVQQGGAVFGDDVNRAGVKQALIDATKKLETHYSLMGRYFIIFKGKQARSWAQLRMVQE
jgi:hypothetical protein